MVTALGKTGAHAQRLVEKAEVKEHAKDSAIIQRLKMVEKTALRLGRTGKYLLVNQREENVPVGI